MSEPTDPREPFEVLLAQLTDAMKVRHDFGTVADAEHTSEDRIAWIPHEPNGIGFEAPRFKIPNAEVTEFMLCRFDVSVYAGSPSAVYQRVKDLAGWLDMLAGPRQGSAEANPPRAGYDVRSDARVAPRGGDAATTGWGCTLLVTLKDFVLRQQFPLAPVTSVPFTVAATEIDGSSPGVAIT